MKLELMKKCENICEDIVRCDECEDDFCEDLCEDVESYCITTCIEQYEKS